MDHEVLPEPVTLRGIMIDPCDRTIRLIDVDAGDVPTTVGTGSIDTIEIEGGHGLVFADGAGASDHPTRFRFRKGPVKRPFFGPALILGLHRGNWIPATLDPGLLRPIIIWEVWNEQEQGYSQHQAGSA